jgi:hypothetical protein
VNDCMGERISKKRRYEQAAFLFVLGVCLLNRHPSGCLIEPCPLPIYLQAEKAIARGLAFEVQYGGAIEESAPAAGSTQPQQQQRRQQQVLANVAAIMTATRGRGLVWSSGADRAEWLRGAHDVMNLAVVLGLKEVGR